MADVMSQGNGFNKILVQSQVTANGTGNLRYQLDMQYAMRYVIILDEVKDLSFIDISGICEGMQYPVHIHGISLAITCLDKFFTDTAGTVFF